MDKPTRFMISFIMTEISFYQVMDETPAAVDLAVALLLEKILKTEHNAVVRAPNNDRLERLNNNLWSYKEDSFISHGTSEDGFTDKQPIYLSTEEENPNNADILLTISGAESSDFSTYARVLDVFDASSNSIKNARERWKDYKSKGYPLAYYAYEDGKWLKKA